MVMKVLKIVASPTGVREMSFLADYDLVKAPAKGVQPTTPEGKKAKYIEMIQTQIHYLEQMKEGKAPKIIGKKGSEVNARTWWQNSISGVICKVRLGKGFAKLNPKTGADAVRVPDFDSAVAFYQKVIDAVQDGSFEKEMKHHF